MEETRKFELLTDLGVVRGCHIRMFTQTVPQTRMGERVAFLAAERTAWLGKQGLDLVLKYKGKELPRGYSYSSLGNDVLKENGAPFMNVMPDGTIRMGDGLMTGLGYPGDALLCFNFIEN